MSLARVLVVMRGTASLPHTTLMHQSLNAGSSVSLTRPPGGLNAQHLRSARMHMQSSVSQQSSNQH